MWFDFRTPLLLAFIRGIRRTHRSARDNATFQRGSMSVRKRGDLPKQANGKTTHSAVAQDPKTDHTRWRLVDDHGRQTWEYLRSEESAKQWPQSTADKWFVGLNTVRRTATSRGRS